MTSLAGGAIYGLSGGLPAAGARPAAPAGDDLAFLQLAAVAEVVTTRFYRRAIERRVLSGVVVRAVLDQDERHLGTLQGAIGADAPGRNDFAVRLPPASLTSRHAAAALAAELEGLIVGILISGVAQCQDAASRLLLGRLLASDARHLAQATAARGGDVLGRTLPFGIDVEAAGARLDVFLRTPTGSEPS